MNILHCMKEKNLIVEVMLCSSFKGSAGKITKAGSGRYLSGPSGRSENLKGRISTKFSFIIKERV